MEKLSQKKCVPCEGGVAPLDEKTVKDLLKQVKRWHLEQGHLTKKFMFKNFKETMRFVNHIAEIAEQEGHHPNLSITYNTLVVELWTHAIGGLSYNDFILAAKIDELN